MNALETDIQSGEVVAIAYAGELTGVGAASYFIVSLVSSTDRIARVTL